MRSATLLFGLVIVAGCADPTNPRPTNQVVGGTELVLAVGEDVQVGSLLRIAFAGVASDSRCPSSVQCFWQGDAAVVIDHAIGDGPTYADTLHTTLGPDAIYSGPYRISLTALMPYPETLDPIPQDAYVVRLRVETLPD